MVRRRATSRCGGFFNRPACRVVIRVLIYSDIRIYRDGLAQVLDRPGYSGVTGAYGTLGDVLAADAGVDPDVVLLDMAAPNALRDIRALAARFREAKIVALGVGRRDGDVIACAEAGVAGYVFRDASVDELLDAVESAAQGELRCSPAVAATLLRRVAKLASRQGNAGEDARMTRREREILELIDHGMGNKQIAARLFIEIATVKNHIHNILEKLGVTSRAEAAAKMRRAQRTHISGEMRRVSGEHRLGP
jgi:two-component system nitrate/nitrite response regulator NarL